MCAGDQWVPIRSARVTDPRYTYPHIPGYTKTASDLLWKIYYKASQEERTCDTADLLCELSRSGSSVAAKALQECGLDRPEVVVEALNYIPSPEDTEKPPALLRREKEDPVSPRWSRWLTLLNRQAHIVAEKIGDGFVGAEHLLLALCDFGDTRAAQVLSLQNIERASVRHKVYELLSKKPPQ